MKLLEALSELGWSRDELARRLGVPTKEVDTWNGEMPASAHAYLALALEMKRISKRIAELLSRGRGPSS